MTTQSLDQNITCKNALSNSISTCLLNELSDAVFLIDPESSNILYANQIAYELVGMKKRKC